MYEQDADHSVFGVLMYEQDADHSAFGVLMYEQDADHSAFGVLQEVRSFYGHADVISDVCFAGKMYVCSASLDNLISVWNREDGHRYPPPPIQCIENERK